MVQSQNKQVDFHTTGVAYLGIGNKVGKFLLGDQAFEFYTDRNVEEFLQIPWVDIVQMGANVHGNKVSRHFEVATADKRFLFASKDAGKILKISRQYIGNDKVVKLPTLIQTIGSFVGSFFRKK